MYDPTIGRWISEDPIGFEAADPNLYRYVRNDPTNATDPSGTVAIGELMETAIEHNLRNTTPWYAQLSDDFPAATHSVAVAENVEIDHFLAPYAVKMAVETALKNLKVAGVSVEMGDWNKAVISLADFNKIKAAVTLTPATTISAGLGGKAWYAPLSPKWELKIYQAAGQTDFHIAVTSRTGSVEHAADAIAYIRQGPYSGPGPNGRYAEEYLGKPVYDYFTALKLYGYLKKGDITQADYDGIIKRGIYLGYLGSGPEH